MFINEQQWIFNLFIQRKTRLLRHIIHRNFSIFICIIMSTLLLLFQCCEIVKSTPSCVFFQILKPVVEKKRRDRINQSLAELRSLLLKHTSDPVSPVSKKQNKNIDAICVKRPQTDYNL